MYGACTCCNLNEFRVFWQSLPFLTGYRVALAKMIPRGTAARRYSYVGHSSTAVIALMSDEHEAAYKYVIRYVEYARGASETLTARIVRAPRHQSCSFRAVAGAVVAPPGREHRAQLGSGRPAAVVHRLPLQRGAVARRLYGQARRTTGCADVRKVPASSLFDVSPARTVLH